MARIPQHSQSDRLRIAEVSGALTNLSGKVTSGQLTEDEAVAELLAITADGHLLAHGVGDPGRWAAGSVPLRLAAAAGVDLELAQRLHDEMHPSGARGLRLGRRDELG